MTDYASALYEGTRVLTTFVVGRQTLGETVDRVAELACETIPGASVAGLTLIRTGDLRRRSTPTRSERAFGEDQEVIAATPATQASVAVANAHAYWDAKDVADQLHEAMKSSAVIEQAKGMLMAAQGCGKDEAFDLLVKASQRSNRKFMVIAEELVGWAVRRRAGSTPTPQP